MTKPQRTLELKTLVEKLLPFLDLHLYAFKQPQNVTEMT